MTARQKTGDLLRLRGCLLALRKLDATDPIAVRETLRRIRRTLAACGASRTQDDNARLAREIIRRMAKLSATNA